MQGKMIVSETAALSKSCASQQPTFCDLKNTEPSCLTRFEHKSKRQGEKKGLKERKREETKNYKSDDLPKLKHANITPAF
jgi:hypothetical protein